MDTLFNGELSPQILVLATLGVLLLVAVLVVAARYARGGINGPQLAVKAVLVVLTLCISAGTAFYVMRAYDEPSAIPAPVVEDHRSELARHAKALASEGVSEAELEEIVREAAGAAK